MKFGNWDLDTPSEEQLVQLGQKVEEAKELRKEVKTYEVTFKVSLLPSLHRLCQFVDDVFALERPEGVSDIRVKSIVSEESKGSYASDYGPNAFGIEQGLS
jgi:hypothetical protein